MIKNLYQDFLKSYDANVKDAIWRKQSEAFRKFWHERIVDGESASLLDKDIDLVVRTLDRNGKGNTWESEAVAKAMIAQGAWRRMFHELCSNKELSSVISKILASTNSEQKAGQIDALYKMNEGKKNNLTGQSGNAINAMLAAYDPMRNLSVISLKHRKMIIDHFEFPITFDYESASVGTRFIQTNEIIVDRFRAGGVSASSRTISCFCYYPPVRALWKDKLSVNRENKVVGVTVPLNDEDEFVEEVDDGPRESFVIQAMVAEIGTKMGFRIWIPKADRSRVLNKWHPTEGVLLDSLPFNYGDTAMKTIENIDVLWLNRRTIIRAFEVEHTTSIYSGLLRMADLLAILPNIEIKLHIVAPATREEKVFEELRRPVFSLLDGGPLSDLCTFISYDKLTELATEKNLGYMKNEVVDNYAVTAE